VLFSLQEMDDLSMTSDNRPGSRLWRPHSSRIQSVLICAQ